MDEVRRSQSVDTDAALCALLHTESDHGAGSYNSFDRWSVALRGRASSVGARLVTAHEAMHAALNDVTAYGVLLAARVAIARGRIVGPNESFADDQLNRLVESCRGTHEAFATYESLWTVAGSDTSLLIGYPRYEGWFKDGSELAPGPETSQRKELMVQAALLACMQPPVLERLAADASSGSQAWWPPRLERPDERLSLLHANLNAQFWTDAWKACIDQVPDAAHVDEWDRHPQSPDLPDGLQTACVEVLYREVANFLAVRDAPTLVYDGHRRYLADVVAAVEANGAPTGSLVASRDDQTVADEMFETWSRERLIIRAAPRPAILRQFADVLGTGRMDVVSEMLGVPHVFASVRPAGRLLEQFSFADRDARMLGGLGWEPVVTLRAATSSGNVELTVVNDPQQMSDLARSLPRRIKAYCNVSLAFLGDEPWLSRWNRSLRHWQVSGLFDLSPSSLFDLWRRARERVTFAPGTMVGDEGERGSLIVLRVGPSPVPVLLACTSVAGAAIEEHLSTRMPTARQDMRLLTGKPGVQVPVGHILTEEHFVDFAAYPK
jgi:hypothetical protein